MKDKSIHCSKCGQDIWQMAERGAYLHRISPKGGPFIGECRPSCDSNIGGQEAALLEAMEDTKCGKCGCSTSSKLIEDGKPICLTCFIL